VGTYIKGEMKFLQKVAVIKTYENENLNLEYMKNIEI
jgi:hypothetical protein